MRCTEATLRALGINGVCPRDGTGVLDAFNRAKRTWRPMLPSFDDVPKTLRSFVKRYPRGCYYLVTSGHALALVNGKLTDTTERGPDKRHVLVAIEVDCGDAPLGRQRRRR